MQGRRTRRWWFGAAVAAAAAVVAVLTAAAAAVSAVPAAPAVAKVTAARWDEAQSISSLAELRDASAAARRLVTTPTVELVQGGRHVPGTAAGDAAGPGKVKPGCYDVWLSTTKLNAFGWVLMYERTTIRNWCTDGVRITSQPTVQRTTQSYWGWTSCGLTNDFAGWLHASTRFGAGGDALFANGTSCSGAAAHLHHDVQVQGDGTYKWTY
jgi:hypothetical protein